MGAEGASSGVAVTTTFIGASLFASFSWFVRIARYQPSPLGRDATESP
jgi:hypothetical protein